MQQIITVRNNGTETNYLHVIGNRYVQVLCVAARGEYPVYGRSTKSEEALKSFDQLVKLSHRPLLE